MRRPPLSDETLMAYADGELDADGIAAVETAMQADPQIADRVALFDVSRQRLLNDLGEAEPISADLLASVKAIAASHASDRDEDQDQTGASVVSFPARQQNSSLGQRWQLPLAASIALVVGLALGPLLPWPHDENSGQIALTGLDTPGLLAALSSTASGDRVTLDDDSSFEAIASFQDGAGLLCREFELDQPSGQTLVSVACYQEDSWSLRFAVAAGQNDDGFAPASSLQALDGYLTAIEAGEPLNLADEADALSGL